MAAEDPTCAPLSEIVPGVGAAGAAMAGAAISIIPPIVDVAMVARTMVLSRLRDGVAYEGFQVFLALLFNGAPSEGADSTSAGDRRTPAEPCGTLSEA